METGANERSFDRDIEDVRLYLSESFSAEEVIYDRANNCYVLSGVARQFLEMTEYRFIERLIIQSELLRKDELIGLLSILASNTPHPRECLNEIYSHTKNCSEIIGTPLLKMHDDITLMISNKAVIEIKYYDNDGKIGLHKVVPYDIQFKDGQMFLEAFEADTDSRAIKYFKIERIESFERKGKANSCDLQRIEAMKIRSKSFVNRQNDMIEMTCADNFIEKLKKQFRDSVTFTQNGHVSICCDSEKFVEWILGQDTSNYEIVSPHEIKERISKQAVKLYEKFVKE